MLNLIGDREYQFLLNMEDEKIRLGGRLVLLLFNEYIVNKILQEKTQTFSDAIEIFGLFEYSDGRNVEESEQGKKTTIDAIIRFSKISIDKINKNLKIGDIVRIPLSNDYKDGDEYQEFTILTIKHIVKEKEFLERVMSYECELQYVSSRKLQSQR